MDAVLIGFRLRAVEWRNEHAFQMCITKMPKAIWSRSIFFTFPDTAIASYEQVKLHAASTFLLFCSPNSAIKCIHIKWFLKFVPHSWSNIHRFTLLIMFSIFHRLVANAVGGNSEMAKWDRWNWRPHTTELDKSNDAEFHTDASDLSPSRAKNEWELNELIRACVRQHDCHAMIFYGKMIVVSFGNFHLFVFECSLSAI